MPDFNDFGRSYTNQLNPVVRTPSGSSSASDGSLFQSSLGFLSDLGEGFRSGLGVVGQGFSDYLNFDRAVKTVTTKTSSPSSSNNDKMMLYAVVGVAALGAFLVLKK